MADRLATIATFTTPFDAQLAKGRLEAEGITVFLSDEMTVGMVWGLGTALGWIKLQVAESDAARAEMILSEIADKARARDREAGPDGDDGPAAAGTCVGCGSPLSAESDVCVYCEESGGLADDEDPAMSALAPTPTNRMSFREEGRETYFTLGDQLAERACRVTIFGLFFFAFLALPQFYALYLAMRFACFEGNVLPASTRKIYLTLIVNGLILVLAVLIFRLSLA
jgi:hypothetical protein